MGRACVWTVDLDPLTVEHDRMEADVEEMLASGRRNEAGYGDQTPAVLHELTSPHWTHFFSEVHHVIERIVAGSPAIVDLGTCYLRAWASKLAGATNYAQDSFRLSAIHNHFPAFLSAVYYVRAPTTGREQVGGTTFINPFPQSLVTPHPGIIIQPAEGRLIVFPSWVMHGPELPTDAAGSGRRLVIGIDVHLVPH